MSDSCSSSSEDFYSAVECVSFHDEAVLWDNVISMNVDNLYDLILENSEFMLNFYESLGYVDIVSSNWFGNSESIRKTKKVAYSLPPNFGHKARVTNSYELLECSVPNELYSVRIQTKMETIKGDCFVVYVHNCFKKITEYESSIFVSYKIIFTRSVWPFQSMIENAAFNGLQNYYERLFSTLQERIPRRINEKQPHSSSQKRDIRKRTTNSSLATDIRSNDSMDSNKTCGGSAQSVLAWQNANFNNNYKRSLEQKQKTYKFLAYGLGLVIMIVLLFVFKIKV